MQTATSLPRRSGHVDHGAWKALAHRRGWLSARHSLPIELVMVLSVHEQAGKGAFTPANCARK